MTQCLTPLPIQLENSDQADCECFIELVEFLKSFGIEVLFSTSNDTPLVFKDTKLHMRSSDNSFTLDWAKDYKLHLKKKYAIKKEPLAKSLGLKGNIELGVVDCTLGTGKDSILMLSFGINVKAYERNVLVFALCADAYLRSIKDSEFSHIFKEKFSIHYGQASDHNHEFDVGYYDPMYPSKKKKALARKEMQVFKSLVGADLDADENFMRLRETFKRLVVKRPLSATIMDKKAISFCGKTTRYERYDAI